MCAMEKTNIVSCEFSFYPLGEGDFIDIINQVLDLIDTYDLHYEIGPMSTFIKGQDDLVFRLLKEINQLMSKKDIKYSIAMTLSNTCGC